MSWNLFEKIINAVKPKPSKKSEQAENVCAQVPDASQSWNQSSPEQSTDSQEPPSSSEDTADSTQQKPWQD